MIGLKILQYFWVFFFLRIVLLTSKFFLGIAKNSFSFSDNLLRGFVSSSPGHVPGTPVYREKEDMYDEIIELKKVVCLSFVDVKQWKPCT